MTVTSPLISVCPATAIVFVIMVSHHAWLMHMRGQSCRAQAHLSQVDQSGGPCCAQARLDYTKTSHLIWTLGAKEPGHGKMALVCTLKALLVYPPCCSHLLTQSYLVAFESSFKKARTKKKNNILPNSNMCWCAWSTYVISCWRKV